MTIEHASISDTYLHEPKGVANASANTLYVASGVGSGTWAKADAASLKSTGQNKGRILQADGSGTVSWNQPVWRDLVGHVIPKSSGPGAPTRTAYRGNMYDWAFILNDVVDLGFHLGHDYDPASDLYYHVHWSHNGTNISGTLGVTSYLTYQKGHNQGVFPAEIAPVITQGSLSIGSYPQYQHNITEIQLSAASPSATQFDSDNLEPDGIIFGTAKLTTLPTVTGGSLFIHYIDIHYKASYYGTANKAPSFYS